MILADATNPDPKFFYQSWLVIAFLVSVFSNVVLAVTAIIALRKKTELEQPVRVELEREFAKEAVCHARHTESTQMIEGLRRERITDAKDAAFSRKGIYKQIEEVGGAGTRQIEALRRELTQHTEAVRKELADKIDDLPDRMIAMLRNTGAIRGTGI